jgi:hypothetical protein
MIMIDRQPTNQELVRHFKLTMDVLKGELSLHEPVNSYAEVRGAFLKRILEFACDEMEAVEEQFIKGRLLQAIVLARPAFEVSTKLLWSSLHGVSGWRAWQSAMAYQDARRIIALRGTTRLGGFLNSLCCVLDDQGQPQDSPAKKKSDEIQADEQALQALQRAIGRGKSKFIYCKCGTRIRRPSSKKVRSLVKHGCPSCGSSLVEHAKRVKRIKRMPNMLGMLTSIEALDKRNQNLEEEWKCFAEQKHCASEIYHVLYWLSSEAIHAHLPALEHERINETGVMLIVGRAAAMIFRTMCRELGLTQKDIEAKAAQLGGWDKPAGI